jgi:hypothetical protein
MTYTKAPLQKIAATVTTKYWLDNSFEVGDTVTLHQSRWDVDEQAFQIVRADIGPRVTNMDMGISQEHLDGLKAGLQRQLDITGIRMHGSTSIFQIGPDEMNYQRVNDSTVYPARLKFEIPSDARYIHKVILSWEIGPYRADTTGGDETEGHDHTGFTGESSAHDHDGYTGAAGAHTPIALAAGAHDHSLDLVLVKTSRAGYLVSQKYVETEPNHKHLKGTTGLPDDTSSALIDVVYGSSCDIGECIQGKDWNSYAEDSHYHLNLGLYTDVAGSHNHNLYTATTIKENYIYAIGIGSNTASEDPDHDTIINAVSDHNTHVVETEAGESLTVETEPGASVELEYGIKEIAAGTIMMLIVNGETVASNYDGNQTDIVITGYTNTGSNTIELQPAVGQNHKGSASQVGTCTVFIEAKKW